MVVVKQCFSSWLTFEIPQIQWYHPIQPANFGNPNETATDYSYCTDLDTPT